MKKRKILIGALLATAVVSLAACTEKEDPTTGSTPSTTVTTGGGQSTTTTTKAPEVVMHKVEFYVENKLVDTKEVKDGWTAVATADPSKENHTFAGWYTDAALTTKYSFGKTVTGDLKLYAKFDLNQYAVTFKTNGGSTIKDVTVTHGNKLTAPANPTKAGYTFAGWYTDEALTKAYDFNTELTGPLTLYANYAVAAHTVTFNTNGGTEIAAATVESGKTVTMPQNPEKAGHRFDGWYTDAEFTTAFDATTAINADTTLYAKYVQQVTVTVVTTGDPVTTTIDINGTVTQPEDPTKENAFFIGWYSDAEFTNEFDFDNAITTNTTIYAKFIDYGKANLYKHNDPTDNYAAEVTPEEVILNNIANGVLYAIPKVDDLEDDYRAFAGWYTDKECTTPYDPNYGIEEDTHLYAKWNESSVNTDFRLYTDEEFTAGTLSDQQKVNVYTIEAGSEVRARNKTVTQPDGSSIKYVLGIKNPTITVDVPADDTTIYVYGNNGSSTSASGLLITFEDGTTEEVGWASGEGTNGGMLTFTAKKGKCVITKTGGTVDIFDITFNAEVDLSPIDGIEVSSKGVVDYIEGQDFVDNVKANIVYQNATTSYIDRETMTGLTVDTSNVDFTTPGTYTATVSYEATELIYGVEKENIYTDTIDIVVYELDSIYLGLDATVQGSNTKAGNGQYINQTVQRIYLEGQEYDDSYLTVVAETINVDTQETKTFILPNGYENDYETSFAADGIKKTITITYESNGETHSVTHNVYVISTTLAPSEVNGVVQIKVDSSYTGDMGAVVDGYNTFNTIQQALDFLNIYNDEESDHYLDGKPVLLELAAGTYTEKIEVTIPNLTIRGAGKDVTKIEWDSLYGIADESGYTQTTDSTQTVAIRETAVNCTITGVTISNWYNSTENFQQAFGEGYGEHRALAILIQSDKFIMDDCTLLGYQDTIELFTGRQLIKNTLITGTTDFIFGTNNTTYFENCEIRSIITEDSYKNGGYITAFKGMNKDGSKDSVTYGAVFNDCQFTADEGVYSKGKNVVDLKGNQVYWAKEVTVGEAVAADTYYEYNSSTETYSLTDNATFQEGVTYYVLAVGEDGKTSIARPWGAYAAVAVINSELGAHISTTGWDGTSSRNLRYVSMSGNNPDGENTKFVEYNNSGVGAITEAVTGCTMLDADSVKNYEDKAIVFGSVNGKVVYADSWAGDIAKDATVVLKDKDDAEIVTLENFGYAGYTMTEDELTAVIAEYIPEKQKFAGFYSDSSMASKYDFSTTLETTNTIYVKFESAAVLSPTSVNFDSMAAGNIETEVKVNDIVTIVGSSGKKFSVDANAKNYTDAEGNTVKSTNRLKTGGASDSSGRYVKFDLSNYTGYAWIEIYSMTGSNSSARTGQLREGAVDGESIMVVQCPANPTDPTLNRIAVECGKVYYLTADASINYYGFNVYADETIRTDKTWTFNVADFQFKDVALDGNGYSVLQNAKQTVDGLTIDTLKQTTYTAATVTVGEAVTADTYYVLNGDAYELTADATFVEGTTYYTASSVTGKFAARKQAEAQINKGTILSLDVAKGATVTFNLYSALKVKLNGVEITPVKDVTFTATEDGTVTLEILENNYITGISVTYPAA